MNDLYANFIPKPVFGINGSGMHCNISLFKDGKNAFYDENAPYQLSECAMHVIGSVLENVRSFSAITNPLVNSYKRLVPGYEAPVYLAWSLANRSALLRVPAKRVNGTRVELRSPDPSCNPYLAFAVILTAAREGIKNKTNPPSQTEENIYHMTKEERKAKGILSLPGTLAEALYELKKNPLIKKALGEHIYNEFVSSKEKELPRTSMCE